MKWKWKLTSQPFEPEYPGKRIWNRTAAQLRIQPADNDGDYSHWMKMFRHLGHSLDDYVVTHPWCKDAGIRDGGDYLMFWVACMIRFPYASLPFLFFYGDQNAGKSILHESIKMFLISKGVCDATQAILSKEGYKAELEGSELCII